MRIEAYYNLHQQCLSARPIGGRVKHYLWLGMRDVTFAVQPAGRRKVLREQKKNVHAFVRGQLESSYELNSYVPFDDDFEDKYFDEVTYNPYKYSSFVLKHNEKPIYQASQAWVIGKRIFVPKVKA